FIRLSPENTFQTIDFLKEKWKKLSDEPFELKFLDDTLNDLYQTEIMLARLITVFGIIAVIIAIMGVYGLIVFNAKYRAKEIAIRKVNGADVREIIAMLNRNILIQLIMAFVIATPLAYFIVHRWLANFAYKTPVYWWVFLLGGIIVFVITLLTVSYQSYKAAKTNPTATLAP
ncbi:MAG: FtsX-like permease family protein, partial [Tannerella sp.]|nr:FtsX-like permease family protein [Tannerella sp.]